MRIAAMGATGVVAAAMIGALVGSTLLMPKVPRMNAAPAPATMQINAAGATFPYPIYSKWFDEYHKAHPEVEINYQSIGSGGGIRQLQSGTVDFGASDMPLTNDQLGQF